MIRISVIVAVADSLHSCWRAIWNLMSFLREDESHAWYDLCCPVGLRDRATQTKKARESSLLQDSPGRFVKMRKG